MLQIHVSISNLSATRILPPRAVLPPTVVNPVLSIGVLKKITENGLELDFTLEVNYVPTVGEIKIAGTAYIATNGDAEGSKQLAEIVNNYNAGKQPPAALINTLLDNLFATAVILAKEAGIPTPAASPTVV